MTAQDAPARRAAAGAPRRAGPGHGGGQRSLLSVGALAAVAVTGTGLAVITLLVLVGFVAAPHAGFGLLAVLRTAAALWLVGHHVGFSYRGAGRIGLLPLGLVVLPGALLWRAGRWVVRVGGVRRLRHVGYAALALAIPYAVVTGALAVVSRSRLETSSLPQAVAWGFLLALAAGSLGGARALAPWRELIRLLSQRSRSLVLGMAGSLAALAAAGALVTGISLAVHLREAARLEDSLAPGAVGALLLLLLQAGYLPNAIIWAVAFTLGPGFAFGSGTVVAPTGSALAQLPALPLLAALPPGLHTALPGWLEAVVLALPYLAGGLGGVLLVRAVSARGATPGTPAVPARGATPGTPEVPARGAIRAGPRLAIDEAPMLGLACGVLAGCVLGLLAAVSGGPLGNGRLAEVGPSAWQVAVVSALELGIAAAVTAGTVNYVALRRAGWLTERSGPDRSGPDRPGPDVPSPDRHGRATVPVVEDSGHVIYLDPWSGDEPPDAGPIPPGPASLP